MSASPQSLMYGDINTDYTITNVLYVIKFLLEAYTLQNNTTIDGQITTVGGVDHNTNY